MLLLVLRAGYHLDDLAFDTALDDVVVLSIRVLLLRQDQVQQDRDQACDQDYAVKVVSATRRQRAESLRTRRAEHDGDTVEEPLKTLVVRAHAVEEVREEVGDKDVAEPKGERGGEHEAVAPREAVVREHAHAGDRDRREEEGRPCER